MKKLLSFTLAALMVLVCVFSFASCGKKGKTLEEVKAAGELVVATSPDFEPFEYLENDVVVGIEVEIMKKICEKLGVTLTLKQMDFDSVLPGVTAGKFDLLHRGTGDRREGGQRDRKQSRSRGQEGFGADRHDRRRVLP